MIVTARINIELDPYYETLAEIDQMKAVTDKFGTTTDGGLVNTVMMLLREANTTQVTAGVSGIQGIDRNHPAFWAGGEHAQAVAFIDFLLKMSSGTAPSSGEYNSLARIVLLHNGAAKVGDFIVEESGRVTMVDPATGKVRLAFDANNLPSLSSLLDSNVGGGTTPIGSGSTSGSRTLSGSVEVAQGGSLTIAPTTITASGSGRASNIGGLIHMASINTRLLLRRGLTTVAVIGSISVPFDTLLYENRSDSATTQSATYTNLAAGTYTLVLEVVGSGDIATKTGTSTATTMTYNWTQEGVNIQQYGLDGMMFFFSDNHFYFTEDGGMDMRGKTNMPGVLLSATVGSGGGFADFWGAKKHASSTATKNSTGRYTVYHSIGHAQYQVTATPTMANRSCHIVSKSTNSFIIEWRTIGSSPALSDTGFHFQITGSNYV